MFKFSKQMFWSFGFVSDFDIRISDLITCLFRISTARCPAEIFEIRVLFKREVIGLENGAGKVV